MKRIWANAFRSGGGFSLVELMVSIFIGLLIIAGVLALFGNTIAGNRDVLAWARLNQELSAVLGIMIREIRVRATLMAILTFMQKAQLPTSRYPLPAFDITMQF